MRPIDADALIEKCGGWYVDECTESGFIGTLENLLATEPTIQPQSTTGQLNDGARSTARSTDLIDRQAAIDALDDQIKKCCKALGSFSLSDVDTHAVKVEMASLRSYRKMLENLPTIQPVATDTNVGDKISKFIDGLEETFAYIREREGGDSVCGLCEYDGAYIGESGDWCNECPGFNRDDCFKLSDKTRKQWTEEIIKALPTIQPERKKGRWLPDNNSVYEMRFICSECKESEVVPTIGFTKYKPIWDYCPNCGAKMKGAKHETD